jgi:hypothetical protein
MLGGPAPQAEGHAEACAHAASKPSGSHRSLPLPARQELLCPALNADALGGRAMGSLGPPRHLARRRLLRLPDFARRGPSANGEGSPPNRRSPKFDGRPKDSTDGRKIRRTAERFDGRPKDSLDRRKIRRTAERFAGRLSAESAKPNVWRRSHQQILQARARREGSRQRKRTPVWPVWQRSEGALTPPDPAPPRRGCSSTPPASRRTRAAAGSPRPRAARAGTRRGGAG